MFDRARWTWWVMLGLLLPLLTACGGDGGGNSVPTGLVEIDDQATLALTAPELAIEYVLPGVTGTFVDFILSDQPNDGDIAFDPVLPVLNAFNIRQGFDFLLFGIDLADPNQPEYRAFLDFPLDGSTGQPVIPLDAVIVTASLTVFVNFVEFAPVVPVLLDLVEYSVVTGLDAGDFASPPLAVQSFNVFSSDAGQDVVIDVTQLMAVTQSLALADMQLRLLLRP